VGVSPFVFVGLGKKPNGHWPRWDVLQHSGILLVCAAWHIASHEASADNVVELEAREAQRKA
jgi:hypothetical protein